MLNRILDIVNFNLLRETTQDASPPSTSLKRGKGTFLDSTRYYTQKGMTMARLTLRRRRYASSSWFGGPESVLPDVLAMHTIEMIPKSMILILQQLRNLIVSSEQSVQLVSRLGTCVVKI